MRKSEKLAKLLLKASELADEIEAEVAEHAENETDLEQQVEQLETHESELLEYIEYLQGLLDDNGDVEYLSEDEFITAQNDND